ncbi:hypothetical protein [Enterococcus gallinarum]|uniref:Uncharacterized protein n=1 Tax=Enterococcus gallinarum TaxID=1353 RepID=A0A376GT86_ENTGA|nr:hypothetical protein [Enterococcus gallinarum]MDT2684840.1 hypothetical protein [Enterococcus gallinarum]STD81751.1 Uncharacterised protein [Enterococcus gallinarum]STE01175.1 Uncharacterised protein [Enterococcus gallinarum]
MSAESIHWTMRLFVLLVIATCLHEGLRSFYYRRAPVFFFGMIGAALICCFLDFPYLMAEVREMREALSFHK